MKLKHTILFSSFTNQTKNILIFYFLKIKCVEKKIKYIHKGRNVK